MSKFFFILFFVAFSIESFPQSFDNPEGMKKPMRRFYEFYKERAYPNDTVDYDARIKAIRQMDNLIHSKNSKELMLALQPEWRNIGPFNIGGRIKSVAIHPKKDGWVYVGAAAGGIWRTTNGGESWEPIFDFENGIAFGSIAIDPNNPDIIYAGTGEAVLNSSVVYLGAGLFKSTDEGKTWNVVGLTNVGAFSKVYVHPMNSNLVVAGALKRNHGFYISSDAGKSWEKRFNGSVSDVSINPKNPNEFIIGVNSSGVYFTSDAGLSWEERNTGLDDNIGRVSVQFAPSNPDIVYALMEIRGLGYIYRTENKGKSWQRVYTGTDDFFRGQGFYNNFIEVHPTNPNIVIAGGIDLFRTFSGTTWNNVTFGYSGGNVHVDQHHAAFDPKNPNIIYLGNDGGMYKSIDLGTNWTAINTNLQVTQFYGISIDYSKRNLTYGGTQDNGTIGNRNDIWSIVSGGDGFRVAVDQTNPNIFYGFSTPGGNIVPYRLNFSTGNYKYLTDGLNYNDNIWDPPIYVDPTDNYTIYHGRTKLYASYSQGDYWSDMQVKTSGGRFTAIAVSPLDNGIIWAGTSNGELFLSDDGGYIWKRVSDNGLINRWIKDIELSRENKNVAYVVYSGFGTSHVFKTTNLGASWIDIGFGLPDVPVNAIALHPENEKMIFIGTDIGVFASFNDGKDWFPYGRNLARSPVTDIGFNDYFIGQPSIKLRAATHGRSIWEVDVTEEIITEPEITAPAGGEVFTSSTGNVISWYGFKPPVKVEFTHNNGVEWLKIADNVQSNNLHWNVPNIPSIYCRIRVSSISDPSQVKISNTFSIELLEIGSIIKYGSVSFIPYGLAYDGKNGLWVTSFYQNKLNKLNATTLTVEKAEISLPPQAGNMFFTDITMDRNRGVLFLHRMNDSSGLGGEIVVVDTNGNFIKKFVSPGKNYPIGLELVDGKLIVGDRDMKNEFSQRILMVADSSNGNVISTFLNPFNKNYGPRGLCYDQKEFVYQICTDFPSSGALTSAFLMRINKSNLSKEVARFPLQSQDGLINARGIDYDPADKNFWVSDFGGNIYKIAGFETVLSANENALKTEKLLFETKIYPNPLSDFAIISFRNQTDGDKKIKIRLKNSLGVNIFDLYDQILQPKQSDFVNLNTLQIPSGFYLITFEIDGNSTITEKITIIK